MALAPQNVEFNKLTLEPVISRNPKGGMFAKIKYNGGTLMIKTPKMWNPTGVRYFDDDNGKRKYTLFCVFDGLQAPDTAAPEMKQLAQFFHDLDNKIIDEVLRHLTDKTKDYLDIYKKVVSREVFEEGYFRSAFKPGKANPKGGEFAPSIAFKLPLWPTKDDAEPSFGIEFFDAHNRKIEVMDDEKQPSKPKPENIDQFIQPRCHSKLQVKIDGIWIIDKKVTVSYKLLKVKVYPGEQQEASGFDDDEDVLDQEEEEEPAFKRFKPAAELCDE